jgi:hypothetical protein
MPSIKAGNDLIQQRALSLSQQIKPVTLIDKRRKMFLPL